jgi:nucleotide-binding universal stress UspA family protein
MYGEILLPTDGSEATERAVEHAVDLAKTYGARLHAVYVVDATAYASLETGAELVLDALEDEGKAAVERVAAAAESAGVDCETHVLSGSTHRTLMEYVEDEGVDLVVMGTHGRRGVRRYLLGSVTERVVRSCPVPVMTVRMAGAEADGGRGRRGREGGADAPADTGSGGDESGPETGSSSGSGTGSESG